MQFFHHPRCSKSRAALALLHERGIEPAIVAYLDDPPTLAELRELVAKLGLPARALLRTGEDEYQALGLDDTGLPEERLLEAMAKYPRLIERPVFVVGDRAVIGRPPERVLELL